MTNLVPSELRLDIDGFLIAPDVLTREESASIAHALQPVQEAAGQVSGGVRNLMRLSREVSELAGSRKIRDLVNPVLGPACFPVRAILFDKAPGANWKVPWHQDVTIAVRARAETAGYGPWSVKAGIVHVQPPANVSEQMLSVRIHLDDCNNTNGALRVLPGTHRYGRLEQSRIATIAGTDEAVVCEVAAGGALLMRPLLLHASSESSSPGHRRVIHLDFAAIELASDLQWSERKVV